jgi:hypothetical protein
LYGWDRYEWYREAPQNLVNLAYNGTLQELNQQIVVINQILVDDVNYGIDSDVGTAILKLSMVLKLRILNI